MESNIRRNKFPKYSKENSNQLKAARRSNPKGIFLPCSHSLENVQNDIHTYKTVLFLRDESTYSLIKFYIELVLSHILSMNSFVWVHCAD